VSSPTDWYDTTDQNEYIGEAHLSKNTDGPKTETKNMNTANITDNQAKVAFHDATGFTPEITRVIEWTKQFLTDFEMPIDADIDTAREAVAQYTEDYVSRNTHYLNAMIAAESAIWNGTLSESEYLQDAFFEHVYNVGVDLLFAYAGMVSRGEVV
tara:strand:+ start:524 stop:988 length:465 start_codon:yes stop_codon:yes gene_type:complete